MDRSFKIFNADRTKDGEVTRYVLLELEYIQKIDAGVTDLNDMDMFLDYNGWSNTIQK